MKEFIRITSEQGFWGNLIDAPFQQVNNGNIDYFAEVAMLILQK